MLHAKNTKGFLSRFWQMFPAKTMANKTENKRNIYTQTHSEKKQRKTEYAKNADLLSAQANLTKTTNKTEHIHKTHSEQKLRKTKYAKNADLLSAQHKPKKTTNKTENIHENTFRNKHDEKPNMRTIVFGFVFRCFRFVWFSVLFFVFFGLV